MFPLTFATWFAVSSSTFADLCVTEYDVIGGCDLTYGRVIKSLNKINSVTECSGRCSQIDRCLSVKYDMVDRVCQLNSERYRLLNAMCTKMYSYAKLTKNSCRKLINQDCVVSTECSVTNSQCFRDKCQCVAGYSYKYINETCVTSCDVYGSTFTAFPGYTLYGYNDKVVPNPDTGDVCERVCAEETAFICRSVDFWPAGQQCYLSKDTAITASAGSYYESGDVDHYHRNCE